MSYVFRKLFLKFIPKGCDKLYFLILNIISQDYLYPKNLFQNRPENQNLILY